MRVPNPSPTLDENCAPMGPDMLSSAGIGIRRNHSGAIPNSNSVLDKSLCDLTSLCGFSAATKKGQVPLSSIPLSDKR